MLSFMYAHLTFFHQGYDLFSELQPLMKQLGGQVHTSLTAMQSANMHRVNSFSHLNSSWRFNYQLAVIVQLIA